MPIRKTKSGGYKYGSKGKKYYGKGARKKALRQARAINVSKRKKK